MKGKSALFWLGLAAAAGGVLFQTSYEVQELEDKLGSLNRQIMDEQEAIQILKAEWSYLNDPTRLENLASQHLQLQPTEARQFVALDVVPMRPANTPPANTPNEGVAPLPPMVRLTPGTPAPTTTASTSGGAGAGGAKVIPVSLPAGMPTPSKPAPIKPADIVPGAGKAPALPAAKSAPAPVVTGKPVDVAARPVAAPSTPSSSVRPLALPANRQPQAAAPNPAPAVAPKPTDSIGVLVARLGANR